MQHQEKKGLIIAIDGPSGAGKSTLGRMIARALGYLYIDTGAMYRAVALAVIERGTSITDAEAIAELARVSDINLAGDPDSLHVSLAGRDISEAIRSERVTHTSSTISAIPAVRRHLVQKQRKLGASGSVVLDGRDIGTVVFPDADVKFYMTAEPAERARRRFEEERLRERDITFEETLADINSRDRRDSTRDDSPLKIADDAIVIDSTEKSIDEVFEQMMSKIRERIPEED